MSQEKVDKIVNILRQEAITFCVENGVTDPATRLIIEQAMVLGGMTAMKEVLQDLKELQKQQS